MQRVSHVLTMKNAARDITFGKDRCFFSEFYLLQISNQIQISGTMRLRHALKFAVHQWRNHRAIFREFVLPPADGEVAAEGLAIIEVSADYRCFQVSALLHRRGVVASGRGAFSFSTVLLSSGASRTMPRLKSKTTRKYLRKFP